MFYDEDSIKKEFDQLRKVVDTLPPFVHNMPEWMNGKNWTDEYRIRDGFEKQEDGSWVKFIPVNVWVDMLQKDTLDLYRRSNDNYTKLETANRKLYEMEYGLRVAQKSLLKALDITGDKS